MDRYLGGMCLIVHIFFGSNLSFYSAISKWAACKRWEQKNSAIRAKKKVGWTNDTNIKKTKQIKGV